MQINYWINLSEGHISIVYEKQCTAANIYVIFSWLFTKPLQYKHNLCLPNDFIKNVNQ